jgi:hypothetical protein
VTTDLTTGICHTRDSRLWDRSTAEAKRLCHQCSVLEPCLEWIMAAESSSGAYRFGTVGGLTARERRKLAKNPLPPHGTTERYGFEKRRGEPHDQPCKDAVAKSRKDQRKSLETRMAS